MLNVSNKPIWKEADILQTGMEFLNKKLKESDAFQGIWAASEASDLHSNESILAAKIFCMKAVQIRKEIKVLNEDAMAFFDFEVNKDPSSEKTQQLKKIIIASDHALTYYKKIENVASMATTYMPLWRTVTHLLDKTGTFCLAGSIAAFGANAFIDCWSVTTRAFTLFGVSAAAYVIFRTCNIPNALYKNGYKDLEVWHENFRNTIQLLPIHSEEKNDPQKRNIEEIFVTT